jgi:hypothetical protein
MQIELSSEELDMIISALVGSNSDAYGTHDSKGVEVSLENEERLLDRLETIRKTF